MAVQFRCPALQDLVRGHIQDILIGRGPAVEVGILRLPGIADIRAFHSPEIDPVCCKQDLLAGFSVCGELRDPGPGVLLPDLAAKDGLAFPVKIAGFRLILIGRRSLQPRDHGLDVASVHLNGLQLVTITPVFAK